MMEKEDARTKFGNDTFYKLTNENNNNIIVITNKREFIEQEKEYWDSTLKSVYLKPTNITEIGFDEAYDLSINNHLIIRRFYENK